MNLTCQFSLFDNGFVLSFPLFLGYYCLASIIPLLFGLELSNLLLHSPVELHACANEYLHLAFAA